MTLSPERVEEIAKELSAHRGHSATEKGACAACRASVQGLAELGYLTDQPPARDDAP